MSQNTPTDNGQRSSAATKPSPETKRAGPPGASAGPQKSADDVTAPHSKPPKDARSSSAQLAQPPLSSTSPSRVASHSNTPVPEQGAAGPSVINKQLLSKLNKSLKEKQKVISQKDTHTKNPTLMHDVLSTSPQQPSHKPSGSLHGTELSAGQQSDAPELDSNDNSVLSAASSHPKESDGKAKLKGKKIAKQNSSRTDFFAAKLASAVDDVDTSDSDETFVYETNPADNSATLAKTRAGAPAPSVVPEEGRAAAAHSAAENINQAPTSIQLVNDNISIADAAKIVPLESVANSPYEMRREDDAPMNSYFPNSRAESVHSLQSSKYNLRNTFNTTTPPSTANARAQAVLNVAAQDHNLYANPYSEAHTKPMRNATRKSSLHSMLSDDRKEHSSRASQLGLGNVHATTPVTASFGLNSHAQNINEPFNDVLYSYDQDVSDDASSHEDYNSIRTEHGVIPATQNQIKNNEFFSQNGKVSHNTKSSTTSSKLRSTTSKLFDKRGAQPRRYSTIPDDIDIEDIDDELIYYDNQNMRFPYNSNQSSVLNESTSLLGGHKLPHHRSLNLNLSGKRAVPYGKSKRYSSLGFVPPTSPLADQKKPDIFPFPYPENQHGYYDLDEYDEEALDQAERMHANHLKSVKPYLTPGFTNFGIPKKASSDALDGVKVRIFKNIVYALIGVLCFLSIGFISGFLLASTKDLSSVSISSIENALVSQDELVFSVVVEALNPGWFTVSVEDLEIDIFAKSGYLEEESVQSVETVLLGTVLKFEFPLDFEGSFFSRKLLQQTGELKLIGPGRNFTGSHTAPRFTPLDDGKPKDPHGSPDNAEKWAVISKHPFDLILRGVIKYKSPMTSNTKSVVVNKVGYIDPSISNYQ